MTQRLQILFVGDREFPEFRQAFVVLQSRARVVPVFTAAAAGQELDAGLAADVIVIAFRRPGEFSHDDVGRLRRLAPLAPIVALLGSLCEGEARSGDPPPGVVRIYWHQWETEFVGELSRLSDGGCPRWGLPATATPEERQLHQTPAPVFSTGRVIAVQAQCREMEGWLIDTCRTAGYGTVTLRDHGRPGHRSPIGGIAAAIWESTECGRNDANEIRQLGDRCGGAPVLAILGFPRLEDRDRALTAAAGVFSKPVGVNEVLAQLEGLARP